MLASFVAIVWYLQTDTEGDLYRQYKDETRLELSVPEMIALSAVANRLDQLEELTLNVKAQDTELKGVLKEFIHLKRLRILGNGSQGMPPLPDDLYLLKQLRYLEIRDMNVEGLPTLWQGFKNLQSISVINCNLSHPPVFFNKLQTLHHIDLSHNALYVLPYQLWRIKSLKTFRADDNLLWEVPIDLFLMDSLEVLSLSGNAIEHLKVLPYYKEKYISRSGLRVLRLDNNMIKSTPRYWAFLPQLEILDLSNNELKAFFMPFLESNITQLDLSGNRLSTLPDTASLNRLEQLNLAHNRLTQLPNWIKQLKYLSIEGNTALEQVALVQDSTGSEWPTPQYLSASEFSSLELALSNR